MAYSSDMHAASQLELVQRQLSELQDQEQQIREQLSHRSQQVVNQLEQSGSVPVLQEVAERPLRDLLREATALDAGVTYLDRLEELQQTVAGLKHGLASVQRVLDDANWHAYLTAVLHEPLSKYGHVQASSDAFAEVPTMGLPDRLVRQGERSLSRGKGAQDQLLNGLNMCLSLLLAKCCWPPPLASDPHTKRKPHKRSRADADADADAPDGQSEAPLEDLQSPGSGSAGQGTWDGFDAAGPVVLEQLQKCIYALMECQQVLKQ